MKATGYSGASLAKKLGISAQMRVLPIDAPTSYSEILSPMPEGVQFESVPASSVDVAHVFASERKRLVGHLSALRSSLRPNAVVWVSWPKKAARVTTDITEDTIREIALPLGYVDVKVCAINEVWSGLKLVVRKGLR